MGPRVMRRLPRYVHAFIDRHGRGRYYFRKAGHRKVALPGLPFSTEFMDAYQAALDGAPRVELGSKRSKPGSVAAAVAGYFACASFAAGLAPTTRSTRRRILERFREQHGEKAIATLGKGHVERMVRAKAATPGAALNFLVSLRALMRHAVTAGLRADDPTIGVRAPKYRSDGFYTWTDEDIGKFEARHPIGTRARLAMSLLLYTAQRRADVVRLGRQHIREGVLTLRQQKTGTTLSIPVHPELKMVLDATPIDNMTFLTAHGGKPLSVEGFSGWFRRMCHEAGLPSRAAAHGLRKAACRRLAELGCSDVD